MQAGAQRFAALDGWRAISILLVLAAHLLPLGPKAWRLNEAAGPMGMALFFTLSGFLITRFLMDSSDLRAFIIRRFFRIVPLAWLAMGVAALLAPTPGAAVLANLLFVMNLPPQHLLPAAPHLWSLGIEMQFYVAVAALTGLWGRRALYLLPLMAVAVTLHRLSAGAIVDIVTWRRVDEILAGGTLALVYGGWLGERPQRALRAVHPFWLLPVLMLSSHPDAVALNYVRPYAAAALVGTTLFRRDVVHRLLEARWMAYVAAISYALYIIHGVAQHSWLGSGETLERYTKLPLLLAVTFGLAHLSTFYFEKPCTDLAKAWLRRRRPLAPPAR